MREMKMRDENCRQLFDDWSSEYDSRLQAGPDDFPHAGYNELLHAVLDQAGATPDATVLESAGGTGNLAELLVRAG